MEVVMSKPQPAKAKLSDAQLVILSAAAQRPDGSLLPLPESLAAKGAALNRVMVEILCKRKLAEERPTIKGAPEWRRNEDGQSFGLFITNAGLLALGIDDAGKKNSSHAAATVPRQRKMAAAKSRGKAPKASPAGSKRPQTPSQSKQNVVIHMLRRKTGVTIDEIIAKTGWQPHSVRGSFSGLVKKKLKLPLVSDVGKDGVRRYHIAAVASAKD
jgi:hypothetical protein